MESEIISSENVRSSSPTPQNLRTYKFSMPDQLVPTLLVPFVHYFPSTMEISDLGVFISQTTEQMERSLSVILTRFYPFAGRLNRDGKSIDCRDEGVPFVVAKFTGKKLSNLLRNPDNKTWRCLLPCEIILGAECGPDPTVVLIKVNYFDCGGIAIGVVFEHRVRDATTVVTFLYSWAGFTRGSKETICPNYILQSIFPHVEDLTKQNYSPERILKTRKSFMRRYVFDASAISSLKSKSAMERATRVEVVSALSGSVSWLHLLQMTSRYLQ